MTRKKKQKLKNKKKKIILISTISACILILLGCVIWYHYDKINKQSTISVKDDNVYMVNPNYDNVTDYWLSFEYNVKGTYKINFDVYEENKKIDEQNHFVYLNDSGTCYFVYRNTEPGKYVFDVYKLGDEIGNSGSFTINFNKKYSGIHAPINSKFDSNKKNKLILGDKKTLLFKVLPGEEQCFEGVGCGYGTDPKTRIEVTIKKVKKATDYIIEGIA